VPAPLSALDLQISQGQAVLGLLERSEVPPLPAFYRLFYDYVAGVKGLFSVRLHSILTHAPSEGSAKETVYEEFIRPYQTDESFALALARTMERLRVLDALMGRSLAETAKHSESLAAARLELETGELDKVLLADLVARVETATTVLRKVNLTLSDQLTAAQFELEETREELRKSSESARRDSLTGLMNPAGIDLTLSQLIKDAATEGRSFALAVVDIDHFKPLNDNYGHQIGDEILRTLGRILLTSARTGDVVGRVGGDEFVVIMPDTVDEAAKEVAARMCAAAHEHDLRHVLGNDVLGGMTVSIGIAGHSSGDSISSLFERADKALYSAKSAGRNRVALAGN